MEFDEKKWDDIVRQWEDDDPGVSDVDTPPRGEMTLPEMNFAEPEADPAAAGGGALARDAASATRLRAPTVAPGEPPPASVPATVGAGQKGTPSLRQAEPTASKPPPESLDWKGLGDRLGIGALQSSSSKAYENMFANIAPGYRPNPHAGDVGLEMARGDLGLAKEKHGFEAREKAGKVKDAMANPNSLQSQKARDSIKAFFGDVQLPTGFDGWSANDVQQFANSGTLARVAQAKNAAADDARKVAAAQEKAGAEKASLDASRKNWTKELKELGVDPGSASQKDIDRAISLKHAAATEHVASSNLAISRANEGRKAGEHESLKQDIPFAGTKLKYTGTGDPREEDVREAQKYAGLYGAAIRGMDDLGASMTAFAQHPSAETRDDVIAKTQAVSGHLNTAAGQGAMSKDEKAEMEKALGVNILTPGGVEAIVNVLTGDDKKAAAAMTRRLKAVRQSTKAAALGKMEPYHFGEAPSSGGGAVRMKFKNGNVRDVPAADVEEAKLRGWVEATDG